MTNKHIWVLTDTSETTEIFASLTEETVIRLATLFYENMEDETDPDAPKSVQEVKTMIKKEVIEGEDHLGNFLQYQLSRQELNTLINGTVLFEDPEFIVEPGAVIYEAATRVVMGGCDLAYALSPEAYMSKKIADPALEGTEWIKWELK